MCVTVLGKYPIRIISQLSFDFKLTKKIYNTVKSSLCLVDLCYSYKVIKDIMVDYRGKLVLAPMVRAGELPTRLLALKYGADLVWGMYIIYQLLLRIKLI